MGSPYAGDKSAPGAVSTRIVVNVLRNEEGFTADDARTVRAVYARIPGEGLRRDHIRRLAAAEQDSQRPEYNGDTWGDTWSRKCP